MSDVAAADPAPDPTPAPAPAVVPDPAPASAPTPDPAPSGDNVVWPDKWREEIAGTEDKEAKRLTRLGRFDHPGRIFDSFLELEQTHKNADVRTPFPTEGNDEDKNKWRKGNDIPAEAGGYFEKLPDGLVVGEEDRPGMDVLVEAMHAVNAPTIATHAAMGAYYKHIENVATARAEMDADSKKTTDDALHELYGADFRRNVNDLNGWLSAGGEEVKAKLLSSRMPDGTPLGNDPDVLKWLIGQMRTINPLVTVPGLGGGDPAAALDDEIATIENTMKNDNRAYQGDKKMQDRYLTLLTARDTHK